MAACGVFGLPYARIRLAIPQEILPGPVNMFTGRRGGLCPKWLHRHQDVVSEAVYSQWRWRGQPAPKVSAKTAAGGGTATALSAAAERSRETAVARARGQDDARRDQEAEEAWDWACEKINSGELRKGGSVLDGCALYRDADWLLRIRRWPPSVAKKMGDFIALKGQQSAK